MSLPPLTELVAQLAQAIRLDDDLTLLDVSDALAARIGRDATMALIRALLIELRSSTTALQLQAPLHGVHFA